MPRTGAIARPLGLVGAPALAGGDSPAESLWGHHEVGALCALAVRQWDVADPCLKAGHLVFQGKLKLGSQTSSSTAVRK